MPAASRVPTEVEDEGDDVVVPAGAPWARWDDAGVVGRGGARAAVGDDVEVVDEGVVVVAVGCPTDRGAEVVVTTPVGAAVDGGVVDGQTLEGVDDAPGGASEGLPWPLGSKRHPSGTPGSAPRSAGPSVA